ncbi:MAG: hypothetical protein RLZ22_98 [Verrucomicrobiota bacterium]|jgi:hypothetical protein
MKKIHTAKMRLWAICLGFLLFIGCASTRAQLGGELNHGSKVMVIGDSLTVGPFGDYLQDWLLRNLPQSQVAIYASCGSSPEHWMISKPNFITPCGYRETTPYSRKLTKYQDGRKPTPTVTPKIETLLKKFRPDVLVIQLGTNHFDTIEKKGEKAIPELREIYRQFSKTIIANRGNLKMVYWITPPDASKYSTSVKTQVQKIIHENNRNHGFREFYSGEKIRYVKGVSGTDGVHLNREAAYLWFVRAGVDLRWQLRTRGMMLR